MEKAKFEAIDPLIDELAEMIGSLLESAEMKPIQDKLSQIANLLGIHLRLDFIFQLRFMTTIKEGYYVC